MAQLFPFDEKMKREVVKPTELKCPKCGETILFNQPYPYHAGFGNQGFLYNKTGNSTLVWSSFDTDYGKIVGEKHPWTLTDADRKRIEEALLPSPDGSPWGFEYPARCSACGSKIADAIGQTIYYYFFDGGIDLDDPSNGSISLAVAMKQQPSNKRIESNG